MNHKKSKKRATPAPQVHVLLPGNTWMMLLLLTIVFVAEMVLLSKIVIKFSFLMMINLLKSGLQHLYTKYIIIYKQREQVEIIDLREYFTFI